MFLIFCVIENTTFMACKHFSDFRYTDSWNYQDSFSTAHFNRLNSIRFKCIHTFISWSLGTLWIPFMGFEIYLVFIHICTYGNNQNIFSSIECHWNIFHQKPMQNIGGQALVKINNFSSCLHEFVTVLFRTL